MTPTPPPAWRPPPPVWRHFGRLIPLTFLWVALIGWLAWLLYNRANWTRESDEADVREWITESRVFRKALPELVEEYADLLIRPEDAARADAKYEEIQAHIAALTEPTRMYSGKLPLFPEVYHLGVDFPDVPPPPGRSQHPLWASPVPRPGTDVKARVSVLESPVGAAESPNRPVIRCEYRIHTNHRFEQVEEARRYWQILLVAVLIPATGVAGLLAFRSILRDRRREIERAETARAAEHRDRELLETRLLHQAAEREAEQAGRDASELNQKLLEQELEAVKLEGRAVEAERESLEMKSQLYASIGIMAGSYAHNIKNLLVRPNDLLNRCIDADGMSREQEGMLQEVKSTLGTVTERLQEILRTVRRDPNRGEMTRVDVGDLVRDAHRTWADMAWERWKVRVTVEPPDGPLPVAGDLSHLQQAIENLIFNARDATFEMRNHLREEARRDPALDPELRKVRLIEAAAWKGEVAIRARRDDGHAILEVQDNGIGMTDEVRRECLKTHFSTKRDNALYEGYSAGMGLGLSFVAVVLEHHRGTLEIDSAPHRGALFRIHIPLAET